MKRGKKIPPHLLQEVERAGQEAALRLEIEMDMRDNPAYKKFFARYRREDVEDFIKNYAYRKYRWLYMGEYYCNNNEEAQLRFLNLAESCYWQIQQKKLFNLQCQWRAEKIKLEEVACTFDFYYWGIHIKHCPFLPSVTNWELDLYMDYLRSDECEIGPDWGENEMDWQHYVNFKKELNEKDDTEQYPIPLWYHWYDKQMNTHTLLELPDLRGEKEDKYIDIYYKDILKEELNEPAEGKEAGGTHYLSATDEKMIEKFVRTFEDKQTLKYYLACEAENKPAAIKDELADLAFKELREAGEAVPISGGKDWRIALIVAWEKYRIEQVIKLLPMVHEDYLQKRRLGIAYPKPDKPELEREREEWREVILEGRKLAGEKADWDF